MTSTEKYLEALGDEGRLCDTHTHTHAHRLHQFLHDYSIAERSGRAANKVIHALLFLLKGTGTDKEHKESLLFSALTKFMTKSALSSISEIERSHNHPLLLPLLIYYPFTVQILSCQGA